MASPELKITVGDLDAGGQAYAFVLRAPWVRGILEDHEATAAGPDGHLDVRASRSGTSVVVHGKLSAELTVPCARCLTPVPIRVDETLSLLFVPGKAPPLPVGGKKPLPKKEAKKRQELEEYEITPEDADTLAYDGETVVLDDVVRDELILATPIFPLCSEDCPGMSRPPDETLRSPRPRPTARAQPTSTLAFSLSYD